MNTRNHYIQSTVLFLLTANLLCDNAIDIPVTYTLDAPLKVSIDLSALNEKIKAMIKEEINREIEESIKENEDQIGGDYGQIMTTLQNHSIEIQSLTARLYVMEEAFQNELQNGKNDTTEPRAIGFHAKLNPDLTLGSMQTVIFDNVITNIGNAYNLHTGHFTAPYDGMYFFASSFLKRSQGPSLNLQMVKNSDEISKGHSSPGGSETGAMNALVSLRKGDVVKVRHFPGSSNSEIMHGGWSYFTGFLIK